MKSHPLAVPPHALHRGFTLLELLVVMVIIAILASLTLGAFRYAQESSARNRTVSSHGAIRAALEQYKEKFGEYPEPANPTESMPIGGNTFRAGSAQMLYQAITGDGTSAIKLNNGAGGSESDGQIDDSEKDNVINFSNLPKTIIYPNVAAGTPQPRILVDGWSHPFQYTKADPKSNDNLTVNPTYDLWSYGPAGDRSGQIVDADSKRDPTKSGAWIKNW